MGKMKSEPYLVREQVKNHNTTHPKLMVEKDCANHPTHHHRNSKVGSNI